MSNPHMLHVWNIAYIWLRFMVNVSRYSTHGAFFGSVGLVFFHFEVRNAYCKIKSQSKDQRYIFSFELVQSLGFQFHSSGDPLQSPNRRSAKKPFRSTAKASRWGFQEKYIRRKMNECPLKKDHTVDGSLEIGQSPVEVGSLDHYVQWFYTSQVVVWDF